MELSNTTLLRTESYIHGKWVKAEKKFSVTNPFNGDIIAKVTDHGKA